LLNFVLVLICCGFVAVLVDVVVAADKFSASAEVLPPGVETDGGGFCTDNSTPSE